jgi:hypothetical protein
MYIKVDVIGGSTMSRFDIRIPVGLDINNEDLENLGIELDEEIGISEDDLRDLVENKEDEIKEKACQVFQEEINNASSALVFINIDLHELVEDFEMDNEIDYDEIELQGAIEF